MSDPTRRQIMQMADEVGITDYAAASRLVRRALAVFRPTPPAEGERRWTEGICCDGAAILFDGVMVPVHEVVRTLNCRCLQPPVEGEGPSEYEWKDIGYGRPVQVQRCHKCGVCPSNVDDCGHFGDSRCPYFGIDALAAPSAPEPVGEGPTPSDVTDLFYRHMGEGSEVGFENAIAEALARWGHQPARLRNCPTHGQQPPEAWGCPECVRELREELHRTTVPVQPTQPAEWEVAQLVAWLRAYANVEQAEGRSATGRSLTRAAELLQQQHPAPVPVSERLPGPGEMDGSLVWCGSQAAGLPYWEWCLDDIRHPGSSGYTHWLPANTPALPTALPLPQGEVEE